VKFCVKHPQLIRRLRRGTIHKDSLYDQRRLFSVPRRLPAVVQSLPRNNYTAVPSCTPEGQAEPPATASGSRNLNVKPPRTC